ncbi:MAG: hypothetical protein IPH88_16815 [Bacteroidales bacterium]|nr:hypothetical protein [Bacteroidales bacterium]
MDSWNSLAQMKSGQTSTGIIVADKSNKLWVSLHRSGILVFGQGGGNTTLLFADKNKPDNLIGKDIHDIQLIDDGSICFTADNRLFKVNASDYAYTSYSPEIKDERIDRNKTAPEKIFSHPVALFCEQQLAGSTNSVRTDWQKCFRQKDMLNSSLER